MGKISTFLAGLFILGASQAVTFLEEYASSVEGTPVDYGMLVQYASTGLFYLGAIIVGYALLSAVFGIILHNYRKRKELNRQEEEERRRRERLEERGYAPQGQPPQEGQRPQNQGGGQQQGQRYQDNRRR